LSWRMAKSLPPRDHAISILRSAIGAIADELALRAISTALRDNSAERFAGAAHDITVLAEACSILARRFSRHDP